MTNTLSAAHGTTDAVHGPSSTNVMTLDDAALRTSVAYTAPLYAHGENTVHQPEKAVIVDIEHQEVLDDPRKWSNARKNLILFIIASAAFIAGLAANIYNPGIADIQRDLHATSGDISLSLALFILIQGVLPLFWSVASELGGRKIVYIASICIAMIGALVAALSQSIGLLIGMRCFQGLGSSAVLAIGAATLADIYDPLERGTKMGIYYAAPLLGPSLGPMLGGVLTQYLSWRATFWFLFIWMGICVAMFVFLFRDTYRRERSLTYQSVLRRHVIHRQRALLSSNFSSMTTINVQPVARPPNARLSSSPDSMEKTEDVEAGKITVVPPPANVVKVTIRDANPIPPLWMVLRRWNNVLILTSSGLIFGLSYCISYTCARTLEDKYGYDALKTGIVLLAYGVGSMCGSVLGGRWSDRVLRKLKDSGKRAPEIRLESTKGALLFFPFPVIAYGWLAQEHIHIAAICAALFFTGFFSIWIYSATLAYIVDANTGRSSSAVATNSLFRGVTACLFAELAVPLQDALGDGGLYSMWAGLVIVCEALLLLVLYRGGRWRERAEERERERAAMK